MFYAAFLSQIGNGGDTLATFGMLFADSLPEADTLIAATLAVTSIAIAAIANSALKNDRLGRLIGMYTGRVAPFILIAVSVYVLANTATDLA